MPRFKRMLLVEDDARDVELTLEALEESNLANEVDVTRDGLEALDYLYRRGRFADRNQEAPAVVLLDLKMPKVSGIEVLRKIKSDESLKMIPVVVLSSSAEERDVIESYKLGVNAYVVKPVDIQQFLEAIRKLGLFWALVNEPPPNRSSRVA
jgi:CheY-like chemotaxis protein